MNVNRYHWIQQFNMKPKRIRQTFQKHVKGISAYGKDTPQTISIKFSLAKGEHSFEKHANILVTNISVPQKTLFTNAFPFPKVGYLAVSYLKNITSQTCSHWNCWDRFWFCHSRLFVPKTPPPDFWKKPLEAWSSWPGGNRSSTWTNVIPQLEVEVI